MKMGRSSEAASCTVIQEFRKHFMQPEHSLPGSQEPCTAPYPESD
jgi:hypothetical protein